MIRPFQAYPNLFQYLMEYLEVGLGYSAPEITDYLNARQDFTVLSDKQVKSFLDYHSSDGGSFSKHKKIGKAFYVFNGQ